jgi:hypothetical protein
MSRIAAKALNGLGHPVFVENLVIGRSVLLHCHIPLTASSAKGLADLVQAARELVSSMAEKGFGLVSQSPHFDRLAQERLAATLPGKLLTAIEQRITSRPARKAAASQAEA